VLNSYSLLAGGVARWGLNHIASSAGKARRPNSAEVIARELPPQGGWVWPVEGHWGAGFDVLGGPLWRARDWTAQWGWGSGGTGD